VAWSAAGVADSCSTDKYSSSMDRACSFMSAGEDPNFFLDFLAGIFILEGFFTDPVRSLVHLENAKFSGEDEPLYMSIRTDF
jgi:hypothetical protein